ncbi:hypothetical protein ES705_14146 [subsurface metagenome]
MAKTLSNILMLKKRNLVIASIGDMSNHKDWITGGKKNFDLALIYYGNKENRYRNEADYHLQIQGMLKFEAIAKAIHRLSDVIRKYDTVCMPDDDIVMDTATMNRLFRIFHKYNLDMAHPTIAGGIFYDWDMWRCPYMILRYVDHVDRICPLFRTDILRYILNTFTLNKSGWGIELLWGKILKGKRIAIIDDVVVQHRPSRTPPWEREYYKKLIELEIDPYDELAKVQSEYGVAPHKKVFYGEKKKLCHFLFLRKLIKKLI